MSLDKAIGFAKMLIAAAEGISEALKEGTAQLKDAVAEAEKMRDTLAKDRKAADDALDKKFDKG